MSATYYAPTGGLPSQSHPLDERPVFTEAYAYIAAGCQTDIVTNCLPHWDKTRVWVLARPLSGFAETFAHSILEVLPGGGSARPEPEATTECVVFVVEGELELELEGALHNLTPGGYAFIAPGASWTVTNQSDSRACFHWIRKRHEPVEGIDTPLSFVTRDQDVAPIPMPDTNGKWATTRFVDPTDTRHDMHVNIVTFERGGLIPFMETHVMEHGLYVLEGEAAYRLNQDWVDVEPGDYMWLRAFCPQACVAKGEGKFRYLLYKDVNRHARLDGYL